MFSVYRPQFYFPEEDEPRIRYVFSWFTFIRWHLTPIFKNRFRADWQSEFAPEMDQIKGQKDYPSPDFTSKVSDDAKELALWRLDLSADVQATACAILAEELEQQELRWSDILWNENRFHVHASKTEHHKERGDRIVPLFPEVRLALDELWDELGDSPAEYVLPYLRTITNVNPQLGRIIKQAGLKVWPKRWQNLRATRATELERAFPSHVVTRWCGHTERIAKQHYWMTTEGDFEKAACFKSVPLVSQQATESGGKGSQGKPAAHEKCPENQGSAASYKNLLRRQVEDNGLEQPQDFPCLSDIEASAARYPARFAPETAELLEIWEALEETQRAELLALARRLSSRQ